MCRNFARGSTASVTDKKLEPLHVRLAYRAARVNATDGAMIRTCDRAGTSPSDAIVLPVTIG
jgi:hypothetical protein